MNKINKLSHIFYDADIHSVTFTRKDTRRHYANLSRASAWRLVYAANLHANHPDAYIVAMTDGWTLFCVSTLDGTNKERLLAELCQLIDATEGDPDIVTIYQGLLYDEITPDEAHACIATALEPPVLTLDASEWEGGYYPADARVLGWEDAQDHRGPNPFTKPALLKAYDEGYAMYRLS